MREEIINTCKYYENGICSCTIIESGCYCKKIDCVFKQLKRLEQENERLKRAREKALDLAEKYSKHYDECYINGEQMAKKYYKYKSALEEIKAILDKECGIVSNAKVVGIINEVLTP